jgi:hypothetical protein
VSVDVDAITLGEAKTSIGQGAFNSCRLGADMGYSAIALDRDVTSTEDGDGTVVSTLGEQHAIAGLEVDIGSGEALSLNIESRRDLKGSTVVKDGDIPGREEPKAADSNRGDHKDRCCVLPTSEVAGVRNEAGSYEALSFGFRPPRKGRPNCLGQVLSSKPELRLPAGLRALQG